MRSDWQILGVAIGVSVVVTVLVGIIVFYTMGDVEELMDTTAFPRLIVIVFAVTFFVSALTMGLRREKKE